ncbi:MAG: nuclear transport factor 2 family protein, partial [Cyanobacteria bacterium J06576_12]
WIKLDDELKYKQLLNISKERITMMTTEHPNISLFNQLDPSNVGQSADIFSENFIWHFFNPSIPQIEGDYVGIEGLQRFFEILSAMTEGTFQVEPISVTPVGDELVIAHVKDRMTLKGNSIELDAVVVWRVVDGLLAEAWDIPSVYNDSPQPMAA